MDLGFSILTVFLLISLIFKMSVIQNPRMKLNILTLELWRKQSETEQHLAHISCRNWNVHSGRLTIQTFS